MRTVLHEPNLKTIMMVEKAIKDARTYSTTKGLWSTLPRKIQYQTLRRVLEYLEASNKIMFNNRTIIWIAADNRKLKKLLDESVVLR